jgi:queuine tRNA-ribosyltransferase
MLRVLDATTPLLPDDRPRYLMGVGYPRDIVAAVAAGIDMFDCVLPTRNGRNSYAFTAQGPLRLRNSRFVRDPAPLEEGCDCVACRSFGRAAIRHFFFAGEMLGPVLVSAHNVRFYQRFMADVRRSIGDGTFEAFVRQDSRCRLGPSAGDDESANGKRNDE